MIPSKPDFVSNWERTPPGYRCSYIENGKQEKALSDSGKGTHCQY
jgi:hypothetical protein